MSVDQLNISRDRIAEFCKSHHICRLALFGSVLRDDFTPESDVDILVEFEDGHTPGLDLFAMQDELYEMRCRKVNLNTRAFFSPYFRDEVLADAEDLYVQA
ncbi:MAG: nucleotidyltransferase family protein [Phycisphaerae bacterium]